ncbi:MAG: sulfotransferase [Alphaproteobacteria bacterium]|nr:sulfotransferase [Alphaproteobacteria bacterium]MBV9372503.1 sulfotransferase [Alphaproteobacteria bacterium]MBV9902268.1 sulfotransferase [Alphaproteobacteria bacterium]
MTQMPPGLAPALERLRRGDLAGARAEAEAASRRHPRVAPLRAFAGLLAAQGGDPAAAIPHFEAALAADPADLATRINLAGALVATGALERAGAVCAGGPRDPKLLRLAAYVHQQQGRPAEAASAYEAVVSAFPDDFESLNNLGNVRAELGDNDGAIDALARAIALSPGHPQMYRNLSERLSRAERFEERQALMRDAARRFPGDAEILAELGLAEASVREFAAAEQAYRSALRLAPGSSEAWLELGLLLENLNRVDDLAALLDEAEARGHAAPEMAFLKAWALRRQGRFEEAMPIAESVPETIHPARRWQLIAELADRLGRPAQAFAAFEEMNRAALATRPPPRGPSYREIVAANAALITPDQVAAWTRVEVDDAPRAPIFIVGFPRSGTTLLDTLLMNVPSLHVLEELPVLHGVEGELGGDARLAGLSPAEANRLRRRYFEELERVAAVPAGRDVVDKNPLHMTRLPLIHRLFPDARVIFVERHPCDSLLSCFMSNFQLNLAMRSFTDLEEAARTYDAAFDAWARAESLLPLRVHRVRYENMVEDLEAEMRPLLAFLGLEWDAHVLDNQRSAAKRDHIRTASYAQVTEPIYKRSKGRWERYRPQLEAVLPLLAPWAERMGYEI